MTGKSKKISTYNKKYGADFPPYALAFKAKIRSGIPIIND